MEEVQTSEKIIWRVCVDTSDEVEKGNLWLLLQRHAVHEKSFGIEENDSKQELDIIYCKIGRAGCPKRRCQLIDVVLAVENARIGFLGAVHSYTPSLVLPWNRIAPERRSFTKKEDGKNSIDALLVMQNWEMEIKFFFMVGTQRTSNKVKVDCGEEKVVEPVCVMERLVPSPIITSSIPL